MPHYLGSVSGPFSSLPPLLPLFTSHFNHPSHSLALGLAFLSLPSSSPSPPSPPSYSHHPPLPSSLPYNLHFHPNFPLSPPFLPPYPLLPPSLPPSLPLPSPPSSYPYRSSVLSVSSSGEEKERKIVQVPARLYVFDIITHTWKERGHGELRLNDSAQSEGVFQSRVGKS